MTLKRRFKPGMQPAQEQQGREESMTTNQLRLRMDDRVRLDHHQLMTAAGKHNERSLAVSKPESLFVLPKADKKEKYQKVIKAMSKSFRMREGDSEVEKDLGRAHFQQELNRWFESRGIISDLRSHLRHLMISALQSTQIGLKPTDKTSPKAQALNLIVAEYLFRHGCHYTLSVFTSEEGELEEIFNALGVSSSFEELGRLKVRYFQKGYDSSLIEALLQIFTENLTKSQVRKTLDGFEADEGPKLLSENWSGKVVDILLHANVTSTQIAAVKQAIVRVTENEVRRLIVEGRKAQLQMLAEREMRIQEHLRKHEEEIFSRLTEAEKDLNERREMIDEELTDRQKHLTEMALEWNEKHEEILKLSKNFHDIEGENGRLKKEVEKLERKNENLRIEGEAQKRRVEQLEVEVSSLTKRLKEVTHSNVALNERIEVLTRRENKEVAASHDSLQGNDRKHSEESPLLRPGKTTSDGKNSRGNNRSSGAEQENAARVRNDSKWNATEPTKSNFGTGDASQMVAVIDPSEDENETWSNSFGCDKIISSCRESIRALEEESNRINKNYLEYKLKFQSVDSDSEISVIGSDRSGEKIRPPKVFADVIKEDRYCQTISPDVNLENIFSVKTPEVAKGPSDDRSQNLTPLKPETRTPTKRQLQNREFFLKSRRLLQELEKQKLEELNAESPPTLIDSSCQIYTPSSSEELGNFENVMEYVKKSSKKSPPRTVSFYGNEGSNIEEELPSGSASRKKEVTEVGVNQLSKDDRTCLALLEETRIKTPQQSTRKLLRQQILQLESDGDDEMEKLNEEKSNGSPKSTSNGKVSVRRSGSDGAW